MKKRITLKRLPTVSFDVTNKQHIEAMVSIIVTGRQHPTLRFDIEGNFGNVVDMAKTVMAIKYASMFLNKDLPDVRYEDCLESTEQELFSQDSISAKEEATRIVRKFSLANRFSPPLQ